MPGRTNPYDETALLVADLHAELRLHFWSDGVLEERERELLDLASAASAFAEAAATLRKVIRRFENAGDVIGDGGLMLSVREADELLRSVRARMKSLSGGDPKSDKVEIEKTAA